MEQQVDLFTQRKFELMIEMATKKLQQEISALKEYTNSLNSEIGSLKSQISRLQFQPQNNVQKTLVEPQEIEQNIPRKKEVNIVDCRPDEEKNGDFKSGAERNAEPVRPRYGNYESKDVSIDKFFYFGRK